MVGELRHDRDRSVQALVREEGLQAERRKPR